MAFFRLGVVLGVGFGCSFFLNKKTKRDKKAGLDVVLGVVLDVVLPYIRGGVLPLLCSYFCAFLHIWGGVLPLFFLQSFGNYLFPNTLWRNFLFPPLVLWFLPFWVRCYYR